MRCLILLSICVLCGSWASFAQTKKPISKKGLQETSATTAAPQKCPGNGLTQAEQVEILEAHNKARTAVGLAPLKWDCSIAKGAQAWADRGIAGHNDDTMYGENVFVALDTQEKVSTVTGRWESEKPNWNNKPGSCAAGKTCTHYTQMVWRSTSKIGCGINRAGSGKWPVVMVCNYDIMARTGSAY